MCPASVYAVVAAILGSSIEFLRSDFDPVSYAERPFSPFVWDANLEPLLKFHHRPNYVKGVIPKILDNGILKDIRVDIPLKRTDDRSRRLVVDITRNG